MIVSRGTHTRSIAPQLGPVEYIVTLIRTVPESGQYRAGALSFSHVDLRAVATAQPIPPPARPAPLPKRPVPPSQGHQLVQIGFVLNGHFQPARNARDVLVKVSDFLAGFFPGSSRRLERQLRR